MLVTSGLPQALVAPVTSRSRDNSDVWNEIGNRRHPDRIPVQAKVGDLAEPHAKESLLSCTSPVGITRTLTRTPGIERQQSLASRSTSKGARTSDQRTRTPLPTGPRANIVPEQDRILLAEDQVPTGRVREPPLGYGRTKLI